ncbi:MAG: Rieske 2Fe-2S domain-containing protein, partial [Gemmatimonas sp.]|nr:Rieske 2Fe-2S domain-containing protein [Gemmatimonas sp.]
MTELTANATEPTDELHWVAGPDELSEGDRKIVGVGPLEIGVFRVNGSYVAWRNVCPHAGAPVCRGRVEGMVLPSPVYQYEL